MGLEVILPGLLCSGLCCLSVAAVLLVGVVLALRSANDGEGGGSTVVEGEVEYERAESDSEGPAAIGDLPSVSGMPEPGLDEDDKSTVFAPFPRPEPSGGPVEEGQRPFQRSSGQTIIAFDEDDDA